MKYKVGDVIECLIFTRDNNKQCIVLSDIQDGVKTAKQQFQIIAIQHDIESYMLKIPDDRVDDMTGWVISEFHVMSYKIPKALLGKRYCDITDQFILRKIR